MTAAQQEILKTFRKELFAEDILHDGDTIGTDDETLLRFLRARKFDLVQSKKMIKDCQEWRRTVEGVGIDELYRRIDPYDYPERKAVFDCWPMWFHKKGRPLNVHFFGNMDLPKLYKQCTPEKHWQTVIVNGESLVREVIPGASRKAGKPIESVFVIVDLKGFGLSQFWQMKSLARDSFQMSQDYYPETMGQLAIVNAPSSFTFIWAVIKPWLSKETAEKVDVLGTNYKDVLLELVDEEDLPSVLGGKCTCEEEGGCHLSGAGPWMEGRAGWGPKAKAKAKAEKVFDGSNGAGGSIRLGNETKTKDALAGDGKLGKPSSVRRNSDGGEEKSTDANDKYSLGAEQGFSKDSKDLSSEGSTKARVAIEETVGNGVLNEVHSAES